MRHIAEPLRGWATAMREAGYDEALCQQLSLCADMIDAEHDSRIERAKREVRRRMARDMRWATTMLEARESRRHIREGLEGETE